MIQVSQLFVNSDQKKPFIYKKSWDQSRLQETISFLEQKEAVKFKSSDEKDKLQNNIKKPDVSIPVVIKIPTGVEVEIKKETTGLFLFIKGARGLVFHRFPKEVTLLKKKGTLIANCIAPAALPIFGSQVKAIYNMLVGVTRGYKEKMKTVGVGYRGTLETKRLLSFSLGYSHKVYHFLPPSAEVAFSRKNNRLNISGPSLPLISGNAATLHRNRIPDVYNGKGVRYRGLRLQKKEGKKQSR